MNCPKCAAPNPENATYCYLCQEPFVAKVPSVKSTAAPMLRTGTAKVQRGTNRSRRIVLFAAAIGVGMIVLGVVYKKRTTDGPSAFVSGGVASPVNDSSEMPSFAPLTLTPTPPAATPPHRVAFFGDPNRPPSLLRAIPLPAKAQDIAISSDGRYLVVASYDDFSVFLIATDTGNVLQRIVMKHRPNAVLFSADGQYVVALDVYGHLTYWPLHPAGVLGWSRRYQLTTTGAAGLAMHPNGQFFAVTGWNTPLIIANQADATSLREVALNKKIGTPSFSPTAPLLVAGGSEENQLTFWDLTTGEAATYTVPKVTPKSNIHRVAFSADGAMLVTAHMDSSITIWDVATRKIQHNYFVKNASTYDVAFSPGNDVLATAQADGNIYLWHPKTAKKLAVLSQHHGAARRVVFDKSGTLLVTIDDDRIVIWQGSAAAVTQVQSGSQPPSADALRLWQVQQLPQAEPLLMLAQAVSQQDPALLQSVLSRADKERYAADSYAALLQSFQRRWAENLPDKTIDDLHFSYMGSDQYGVMSISSEGQTEPFGVYMVNEGGRWVISTTQITAQTAAKPAPVATAPAQKVPRISSSIPTEELLSRMKRRDLPQMLAMADAIVQRGQKAALVKLVDEMLPQPLVDQTGPWDLRQVLDRIQGSQRLDWWQTLAMVVDEMTITPVRVVITLDDDELRCSGKVYVGRQLVSPQMRLKHGTSPQIVFYLHRARSSGQPGPQTVTMRLKSEPGLQVWEDHVLANDLAPGSYRVQITVKAAYETDSGRDYQVLDQFGDMLQVTKAS